MSSHKVAEYQFTFKENRPDERKVGGMAKTDNKRIVGHDEVILVYIVTSDIIQHPFQTDVRPCCMDRHPVANRDGSFILVK